MIKMSDFVLQRCFIKSIWQTLSHLFLVKEIGLCLKNPDFVRFFRFSPIIAQSPITAAISPSETVKLTFFKTLFWRLFTIYVLQRSFTSKIFIVVS